jgi:hypothetical protein
VHLQRGSWRKRSAMARRSLDSVARYAEICGETLARSHARAGDSVAIAGYLGKSDTVGRALARFAEAYADQNRNRTGELTIFSVMSFADIRRKTWGQGSSGAMSPNIAPVPKQVRCQLLASTWISPNSRLRERSPRRRGDREPSNHVRRESARAITTGESCRSRLKGFRHVARTSRRTPSSGSWGRCAEGAAPGHDRPHPTLGALRRCALHG